MKYLACALALVALTACTRDAPRQDDAAADPLSAASAAESFFRYGLIPFTANRAGLREKFGEPDSVRVEAVKNRHDPAVTDSIAIIYHPGLQVELYLATLSANELTSLIRVSDNRYIRDDAPIRIGLADSELPVLMGEPTEVLSDGTRIYLCDTCTEIGNDQLFVRSAAGRVSAISVQYSID